MEIIKHSVEAISTKDKIIIHLLEELNKYCPLIVEPSKEEPVSLDYQKLVIDQPPIFETLEKLDYKVLLANHLHSKGKPLKPVSRRATSAQIPKNISCPRCMATSEYLYDNSGGRGQYECKVCDCHFHEKNRFHKQVILKCPHCLTHLQKIKQRNDFDIFKCTSKKCPEYQRKLKSMTKEEKKLYKQHPHELKLHYIYRSFKMDLVPLSKDIQHKPKVDMARIHSSPETVGLVLTYYVNYGLSARSTSAIMKDIHNVSITHQTVLNYVDMLKPLFDYFNSMFPYDLSDQFCGDETYLRIRGKWHYLCFFFDAVKKIFLAYPISKNRDHQLAITAINDLLTKLPEVPEQPEDSHKLKLIVDGNPIYLLAQQFFAEHGIHFDIKQVIGLTNKDDTSKEFRPLKNVIERVNRAYKTNIRHFFGFGSQIGAENFTTLFVTFFNFLRPHAALEGKVPVVIQELLDAPSMPARWVKLIKYAQNFTITAQAA
jgi:transposase-like protein